MIHASGLTVSTHSTVSESLYRRRAASLAWKRTDKIWVLCTSGLLRRWWTKICGKKAQRSEIQRGGGGEDVRASQVEEQKGRMTQKKAAEGVNLSALGDGESAVMRWCRRSFWKSPFSSNHMELQEHHHHHHHHHQVYSHFCHFPIAPGRLQYEASALRTRAKL